MGDGVSLPTRAGILQLDREQGMAVPPAGILSPGVVGLSQRPVGMVEGPRRQFAEDQLLQLQRAYMGMGMSEVEARRRAIEVLLRAKVQR